MRRGHARQMIQTLVPGSVCAELFGDVPESTMFASEANAVAGAVEERRREFGTARWCARKALVQIGIPAVPILPDGDGAPRWPAGVVGSITHCAGYRAAAVARSGELRGIGIDAEPHAPLAEDVLDLIARVEERGQLRSLEDDDPGLHWSRILFCAKEAVYKAWFPLTRRWLDFADVSTSVRPNGTFSARPLVEAPRASDVDLHSFGGRWAVSGGLIVAATEAGVTPR
jgi:4'-phosphopantetheinyl transferase EntD